MDGMNVFFHQNLCFNTCQPEMDLRLLERVDKFPTETAKATQRRDHEELQKDFVGTLQLLMSLSGSQHHMHVARSSGLK